MVIIVKKMQKNKVKKIITYLFALWGMIVITPSYAQQTTLLPLYKESITEAALKQYPILPYKFIDLIKILPKPLPVSLSKFQKIFDYQLRIIKKDNDSETYETGSFRTLDGVIIKKVGVLIYLEKKNQIVGLGIYLDPKQCVNTRLLKKEFGFLIPRLLSFHPVSNAPIAFYTTDENGKFVMGSTMDYPDCATDIGLEAFDDEEEKQEWIKYVREQAPHLQERARKRELEGK